MVKDKIATSADRRSAMTGVMPDRSTYTPLTLISPCHDLARVTADIEYLVDV